MRMQPSLVGVIVLLYSALSLQMISCGQIFGSSIKVLSDMSGQPSKVWMRAKFETGLGKDEALKVEFPLDLGPYG